MPGQGLDVILGDYPAANGLRSGTGFTFRSGAPVTHFRKFLDALDVPLAELPIMTFLAAHEAGVAIALLPVAVLSGSQHGYLFRRADSCIGPQDLAGHRIAVRSYTVTTATWIRDILQREHGVDPRDVEWIACEPPHVAGFVNPANVVMAPEGETPESLLRRGDVAAAILRRIGDDPFAPLIPDAEGRKNDWQINHMICVTKKFAAENPQAVAAFMDRLGQSSERADLQDRFTIGRAGVEGGLGRAIDCALRQGVIIRPVTPADLYEGNGCHI